MQSDLVSVIVPVYNARGFLTRCAASALTQDGAQVELILVDDGSTDGSDALCDELVAKDPHIRVIHQANGGVSCARNAGIAQASGTWLMLLDADDTLLPGALAALLALTDDTVDAVCGGTARYPEVKLDGTYSTRVFRTAEERREAFRTALEDPTRYMTAHGWLIRGRLVRDAALSFRTDLRYGEDGELMVRLLPLCRGVAFCDRPVYAYTVRSDSTIHRYRADMTAGYLKTIDTVLDETSQAPDVADSVSAYVLAHLLLILVHSTFHPANPAGIIGSWRQARALIREPRFARALATAPWRRIGMARRLALRTLRLGWTPITWLLVKARQRQNARRAQ